jgi:hypothetical protein
VDGYSDFNALYSGKQNEEVQLYAFDVKRLTRGPLGLAPPIDRLQPAQAVAHELLAANGYEPTYQYALRRDCFPLSQTRGATRAAAGLGSAGRC